MFSRRVITSVFGRVTKRFWLRDHPDDAFLKYFEVNTKMYGLKNENTSSGWPKKGNVLVLGAGKKRRGRKGETQQGGAPDEGVCLYFLHLEK
jgi:hypothetical protein